MKKELKQALATATAAHVQADEARKRAKLLDQNIVTRFCTVKIGDVVPVTGYSHNGKQIRVKSVWLLRDVRTHKPHGFKCHGAVLRKDGSESRGGGTAFYHLDMTQPDKDLY